MGLRRVEDAAAEYCGNKMPFRISQFEENGRNIVVSARAILEEARERLAELEATMLELENNPEDVDLVSTAFRAMHTIKGEFHLIE